MSEEKLDRMEGMLTQLVSMVGKMNERQNAMESTINSMKADMDSMKGGIVQLNNRVDKLEKKSEQRHQDIKDQLTLVRADQNLTWEKAVQNERDVAKLKGLQFGS